MNKFKPGDRVVCYLRAKGNYPLHKCTATVEVVTNTFYLIKYDREDYTYHRLEDHLILASVYNSPLYKALS